jgi:hypothetical protein
MKHAHELALIGPGIAPSTFLCGAIRLNMEATFFHEPELEFDIGRHIDIRFGLALHGALDAQSLFNNRYWCV